MSVIKRQISILTKDQGDTDKWNKEILFKQFKHNAITSMESFKEPPFFPSEEDRDSWIAEEFERYYKRGELQL